MSTNKCIVFVSTNINKNGAEKSLISLQSFLNKEKGIETLTVIPSHGLIEELFTEHNIQYVIHPFQGNVNAGRGTKVLRGLIKAGINKLEALKLAEYLRTRETKIIGVHSNTITSEFGCILAEDLRVPHIWHIREFGKLDFNFDFELGIGYMKKCTSKAAKIVCNSRAVMDYYKQYFDNRLLTYVYNGIDAVVKGESDWNNSTFKMVLVGRLSGEKGQLLAIEACKALKNNGQNDFSLDLYGDGVDKGIIEKRIYDYGLNNYVHLCGYCDYIPLSSYHVGLMCSHHEAFGRVTVEYMINAIPVIGVDAGGTSEIIENNISGMLYRNEDVNDLYSAIKKLYSNRELCVKMGKAGRKRALEKFSQTSYWNNVYKIYQEVFDLEGE